MRLPAALRHFRVRKALLIVAGFGAVSPAAGATVSLESVISGGGDVINLNPADTYVGGVSISRNVTIEGNGALIDLNGLGGLQEIQALNGFTVTIRNATVQDGPFAAFVGRGGSTLNIENVTVRGEGRGVIVEQASTVNVSGGSILTTFIGIEALTDSNVNVTGTTFNFATFTAINLQGASDLVAEGATIDSPGRGVYSQQASTATLSAGTTVTGSFVSVDAVGGSVLFCNGATIRGNGSFSVNVEDSLANILNTRVEGTSGKGIQSQRSNLTLNNVTITGAIGREYGIHVFGGSAGSLSATDTFVVLNQKRGVYVENVPVNFTRVGVTSRPLIGEPAPGFIAGSIGFTIVSSPSVNADTLTIRGTEIPLEVLDVPGAVTLANVTLQRNRNGATLARGLTRAVLPNWAITNQQVFGLLLESNNATITNMIATNSTGLMLRGLGGSDFSVSNSTFVDVGLEVGGGVIDGTNSTFSVETTRVESTATGTSAGAGIKATGGSVSVGPGVHVIGKSLGVHLLQSAVGTVRNSRFDRNGEAFYCDGSSFTGEDNYVTENTVGQSLQTEGFSTVVYRRNQVYGSKESGVGLNSAGTLLIEDNYFQDLTFGGISISPEGPSPVATVRRNTVRRSGNPGGLFTLGSNGTFTLNLVVDGTFNGIQHSGAGNDFERNLIKGFALYSGNLFPTGTDRLAHNFFVSNQIGLLITSGIVTLDHNHFENIGGGLAQVFAAFVSAGGRVSVARGNTFVSNNSAGLWITDPPPTDARQNWWGDPSGPSNEGSGIPGIGSLVRGATFSEWLTAPPTRSVWVDGLSIAANSPLTTNFGNPSFGAQFTFNSPVAIPEVAAAVWFNRNNPVAVAPTTALPNGTNFIYATAMSDARLTINGGGIIFRLSPGLLSSYGLTASTTRFLTFDDDTQAWTLRPVTIEGTGIAVDLPSHAQTIAFATVPGSVADTVDFLLNRTNTAVPDKNTDGVIDSADTR